MKRKFQSFDFRKATLETIAKCNAVIDDLRSQGYTLTLRQLYYQLVSRDIIANKQTEYDRLGSILNNARLAGLVDWDAIEDRTRGLKEPNAWDDPSQVLRACASQYRQDRWKNQDFRPEVWIEKDALAGVVKRVCDVWSVPYFSCRGYGSVSEMYGAGRRLASHRRQGQIPLIIHLGDHDPSGIDMTRDIQDRLRLLSGRSVEVRRIALNMDQIEEYGPPPNPAKESDCRFAGYKDLYGEESWELDALTPSVLEALIRKEILSVLDLEKRKELLTEEAAERAILSGMSYRWEEVSAYVEREFPRDCEPEEIETEEESEEESEEDEN